jgi:hypothetical protein
MLMVAVSLPPKPDPLTGEPRPPSAPSVAGPWAGLDRRHVVERRESPDESVEARERTWNLENYFESAHARRSHRARWAAGMALWVVAVEGALVGIYIFFSSDSDLGSSLSGRAQLFTIIFVAAWLIHWALFYFTCRERSVYAGSSWLGEGRGDGDRLKLYELSVVAVSKPAKPEAVLFLEDRHSTVLQLPMGLIEGNPRLWALVYNGIRHSVAEGAKIESATRELLHLPPSQG